MGKFSAAFVLGLCLFGFGNAQIKVACIGNSITEGSGLPAGALPYPARLQQLLGNGYTVQNDGVSGRTLLLKGDFPYMYDNDGKLAALFAFKPNIVTIKLGTNDTKSQNWDAHKGEFKHDYLFLIDSLNTLSSKPRIFLVLPLPSFQNSIGIRDTAMQKIIVIIKQIALERGLPIIDANTPFKSLQSLYQDGVHPNAVGADTLAHIFFRSIAGAPAMRFQYGSYTSNEGTLPYRLFLPENYSRSQKYPLILTLHGAGERGSDDNAQIAVNRLAEIWAEDSTQRKQKSFVFSPQCPANAKWVNVTGWDKVYTNTAQMPQSAPLTLALKMVDSLIKAYPIDTNRIYVTGLSMGGYGTWDLIARYPGKFAAAIPMSGGCDTSKARALATMPIWSLHGAVDGTVPPNADRSMAEKMKAEGDSVVEYKSQYGKYFANATITRAALTADIDGGAKKLYGEYTDGTHNIWTSSYNDPLLARWLFSKVKEGTSAIHADGGISARGMGASSVAMAYPGDDLSSLVASLAYGTRYEIRILDLKGALIARADINGGAALPAAMALRSQNSRGITWVTLKRLR